MFWLCLVANILILIGLWLVGKKYQHAFFFSILGEAMWAVYGAVEGEIQLAIICVIFCLVSARNWYLWSKSGS